MAQVIWIILAVGWMGGMWYLSDQPDLTTGLDQDFFLRKLAHIIEYAVLTWLWTRAIASNWRSRTALLLASTIAVLYAILDEVHQTWVIGRNGAHSDVGIDIIGIILIWLLAYVWSMKKEP